MLPLNIFVRKSIVLGVVLLLGIEASSAHADHADAAPVNDEVIQKLVKERLPAADPLFNTLSTRLDEATSLVNETERELQRPDTSETERHNRFVSKQRLFAAKRSELDAVRAEVRGRLEATRSKLQTPGMSGKLKDWDRLAATVEDRFDRVEKVLDEVRSAKDASGRDQALSHARSELKALHGNVRSHENGLPTGPTPGWKTETPQPANKQQPTINVPRYMSYQHAPGTNVYAFLGNTLLAPLPPSLPTDAPSNCGILAANDPSLAATQDVQITQEIRDIAAGLNYSPAKIFQYVYQNIKYQPYYGSLKGSVGTLYAKAGGATDQASLLIALLRASNIPARYVKGKIQVLDTAPDALGGRIGRWLGAKSYAGAAAILAQGQNPSAGSYNYNGQIIGVTLTHVWVEACVPYSHYRGTQQDTSGSRWIPLDASFKDASYQTGITTNVAFDYTGYLSQRTNTLADEYYANQILPTVQATGVAPYDTNNSLTDVPYIGTLNPLTVDILPSSTPYEVSSFLPWDGTTLPEVADLPDSHRYKFNITVNNQGTGVQQLTTTLSMPQTALSRVTLSFQGATAADQTALATWQNDGTLTAPAPTPTPCGLINVVPVIKGWFNGVEGSALATGTAAPVDICTTANQLTMSITMAELLKPTINTRTYTNITAAGYHALQGYGFQASDRLLNERAALLLANVRTIPNPNTDLDATEGEFLNLVGLKYMRYVTDSSKRIGQLDGGSGDSGNNIGLTASAMKVIYLFDIPFEVARTGFLVDMPGMVSRNVDLTTGQLNWKTFLLAGYNASALEYYIWHENVRMDAVSTVRGLQFASESGVPNITMTMTSPTSWTADSANLCTAVSASCPNSATLYPAGILSSIQAYYAAGFTITLPKTMIQYGDWIGAVFVATLNNTGTNFASQAGFMIAGGYAGGYTVRPLGQVGPAGVPQNNYDAAAGSGYVTPNPSLPYPTNTAALNNGYDPKYTVVDGDANIANGNVFRVEKDISIKGRGELPLVFERAYNSRNPQNGPLGYGWTHSFNQYLTFKDDNANGAVDTADTDTLTSSVGWTDGTGGEKLYQVTGTVTGVAPGSTFTHLPGTYATMTRNVDGSYSVIEKDGLTYTFENVAGSTTQKARLTAINDRNGNSFTLTYAVTCNNNLCSVKDSLNRTLTFTYNADVPVNHITAISDWTGRQYQYGYTDTSGNLNSYANPLAVAGKQAAETYQYYTLSDGANLNHALKQYTLPRGNGMAYEYYATGKLFRRTDALGYTRTYTYNDFGRETLETTERGGKRRFIQDQFGNTTQFVEENGATHNYSYDTAVPANIYNRISKRDPEGYTTGYSYDALGNITQVTNPSASTVSYGNFTTYNQPGKQKDANGNYTVYKYDAKGNLTNEMRLSKAYCAVNNCAALVPATYAPAATDIVSWKVNGYDVFGNHTTTKLVRDFAAQVASPTATSATGPIITTTFDVNNLYPTTIARTGKKNADAAATTQTATIVFDSLGRQTTGIDADWQATQSVYDTADRKIQSTDALGNLRSYQYDANDNPSGERLDLLGSLLDSRSVAYDLNDRTQTSVDAGGNITAYQYDEAGNVVKVTNPDNYAVTFEYDATNHETRRIDAKQHAVSRSLDATGKPRKVTDPNGNATTSTYYDSTGDGRLKSITDAGNHQIGLVYDANGNPTAVTVTGSDNLTTRTTHTFYDGLDRPVRIVGPQYSDATLGLIRPVTQYVYDSVGNRSQVLAGYTPDATGNNAALDILTLQTTVAWDDYGRKVKETDPLNQAWTYSYDSNNNLVTSVDPLLQTTTYTWDYGHQLKTVLDQSGNTIRYTRNALGQVTVAQSPATTYNYGYDTSHRLASVSDARGSKTLSYRYSPGGLLNYLEDNDGNRTDYLYDAIGQLSGIWAANYDYVSFSYDPAGRLVEKMFSSGVDTRYTYNPDNSLASLTNKHGMNTISSHGYGYDALGNRSTQAETVGVTTLSYSYGYDALNRLTQVQNGAPTLQENYQYDPIGNRTTKSIGATTPSVTAYVYDTANQLKEIRSGSPTGTLLASLTYDADGNLKTRSDTGLTLNYDALNRLTQASVGGQTQNYVYDDQGRRISKTVGATTTNFLYNGADILAEYSATWGLPTAQYTHGTRIDDILIRATATTAHYFHQDGLGSVVGVTNTAGLTDATQRFDAWGNKLSATGTALRYGYTGREPDETGLIFYRARYYDPTSGRFTQRDPIGFLVGINRYAYTSDNPLNAIDPLGLYWVYMQNSGNLYQVLPNGDIQFNGTGYAGQGEGMNNPDMQFVSNTGPLPEGSYTIGSMQDNPTSAGKTLKDSMRLNPDPNNEMGGRGGFLIHDGKSNPNDSKSSKGCIILKPDIRKKIDKSGDKKLVVMSGKGGYTVGGLPGKDVSPAAPYAGNQN